jgi:predicted MFS family arabinose efflux permease
MSAIVANSYKTKLVLWVTWFVASAFFAYQYILRVMPSVIMQDLMQQFDLDPILFGQFSGIYYIGYAVMHLPLGMLLDRVGSKKIMPICIILAVIGMLPILFAENWMLAIIGRLLVGIGSSGAILSAFKVIHHMFGPEKFTRMLSFTVTIGLMGAIYGGGPLNYLCAKFGYKLVTMLLTGSGVMLSLIAYLVTPEFKNTQQQSMLSNIKEVFSNKKIWWVCFCAGLMVGPLEGFADLWGKQFLEVTYGFNANVATSLVSTIFIGACFGSPLLSYIATRINNDNITIFMSAIVMAVGFLFLLSGIGSMMLLSIVFTIIGGFCTYQTYAIFKASTYVREHAVGLTTAAANMIIMLFGYAFHTIIGTVINASGGSESAIALKNGVLVVPLGLLFGAIGFLLIYLQENQRLRFFSFGLKGL